MNLCESCILYGRCSGSCGDTNETFYTEQHENDNNDCLGKLRYKLSKTDDWTYTNSYDTAYVLNDEGYIVEEYKERKGHFCWGHLGI